ncbi:IucA/IucC family protein, partial [Streptomyces daliensis]|nr:IucA/IucC family protein [Streptomyces daliensis]
MSATHPSVRGDAPEADKGAGAEAELLLRVLDALLREDVAGLRTRSRTVRRGDGTWLRLDAGERRGALLLPVAEDGFQCEWRARRPLLLREGTHRRGEDALTSTDAVLGALRELAEPQDAPGYDDFAAECREARTAVCLHARTRRRVLDGLAARYGDDPAHWTGLAAGLAHDTLAARTDHPVYPTGRARSGLGADELRAYAPEFHPRFTLRWLAVPREAVTLAGPCLAGTGDTGRWPGPAVLGLPELEGTHLALPVHPLTAGAPLREALRATGLEERARLAPHGCVEVAPTLSMRTVALAAEPTLHLKLPLATATLGLRNRRTIKPGTLADGAAVQRLLAEVTAREPRFRDTVLHADERAYAHAGHELLAALVRRYPAGLDGCVVAPLAALLSEEPGGGLLLERLADRFYGGDPLALLDALLTLLLDWQTTLLGYGIALESHQQNVSLVLDRTEHADGTDRTGGAATRLRLLFKDNDGPRIHAARLRATLGAAPAAPFADARILTRDERPVMDLFTTITLHLCAGAYAFGLERSGRPVREAVLGLVRERLAEAAVRLGTGPGEPGAALRARVLDAPALPVKAMVSAGTLLTKERSGAADINKHYTSGPNYLRPAA